MFCNKCGNQLADGARFCGRCGNPCTPVTPTPTTPPVMEELEMHKRGFSVNVPVEPAPVQPERKSFAMPPLPEYPTQQEPVKPASEPKPVQPEYKPFAMPPLPEYPPQPEPVQSAPEPKPVQPEYKPFAMPPLPEYPPQPESVKPAPEPTPVKPEPVSSPMEAPFYASGETTYLSQEESMYTPEPTGSQEEIAAEDLPPQYRPLSAWSYFGWSMLYSIPVVGWVFLIMNCFKNNNINRRSFTRSFWITYLIYISPLITFLVLFLVAMNGYL